MLTERNTGNMGATPSYPAIRDDRFTMILTIAHSGGNHLPPAMKYALQQAW
jgi:hypothetical protein